MRTPAGHLILGRLILAKAGRKQIDLSDEQRAQVEALAAYLNTQQIADYLGISRKTFYLIMERDDDIAERYNRGRAKAIESVAKNLVLKARDGDNACMMFYLKTQAGWRETSAIEHSGPNGSPIQLESVNNDAESFASRMASLAAGFNGSGNGENGTGNESDP